MADAFLRELFRAQNRVQNSGEEQMTCVICMEDCGTADRETGLVEFATRLPCKHIVGSDCIAQWLHSSNTCPICRHVLYPTQSGLHLEQGLNSAISVFWGDLRVLCGGICAQLSLDPDIQQVAISVAGNLLNSSSTNGLFPRNDKDCLIAVCIYIASNITGEARSPREISAVIGGADSHSIRATYEALTSWTDIIDNEILNQLLHVFYIDRIIWPPHREELRAREADLENLINVCTAYSDRLALPSGITTIAQKIASRVWNIASLRHTRRSPRSLAAACVYMAGHLMGLPRSMVTISEVISRVRVAEIEEVYRHMYRESLHVVQESWLRIMRQENMHRALMMLPAI